MLLTFGDKTIKVVRWWPETKEVSYYLMTKKDKPLGTMATVPISKLKYQFDKHATGAVVEFVVRDRIVWKH